MKIKITNQYLYHVQHRPGEEPYYDLFYLGIMGQTSRAYTLVQPDPLVIEVDVPDDFDPRQAQVAAVDRAIIELRAETENKLTELVRLRNELLAIEAPAARVPDPADNIEGHEVPF